MSSDDPVMTLEELAAVREQYEELIRAESDRVQQLRRENELLADRLEAVMWKLREALRQLSIQGGSRFPESSTQTTLIKDGQESSAMTDLRPRSKKLPTM